MKMRLSKAWLIAAKDLRIFLKKKTIMYSAGLLPFFIAVGTPLILRFAIARRSGLPASTLVSLMNAFSFFPVILAAFVPISIASYSLVGEKIEKSLEPLLSTPITDGELFLGKAIAGFIPTIVPIYLASAVYMILADVFTYPRLGYYYLPSATTWLILFPLIPLAVIFSIELGVLISSRVSDVRSAQTLGGLALLPFAAIYVGTETGLITLDDRNLVFIAAATLAVDIVLYVLSTKTFRREEILTKWK
jgi:ABC-type transport system involved in multi-copper enzyme maturation permease subunit